MTPSIKSNLASVISASLMDNATLRSIELSWSLCCLSRSSPRPLASLISILLKKIREIAPLLLLNYFFEKFREIVCKYLNLAIVSCELSTWLFISVT